ncbi:conserved hypothetical protein [delta proteobacterium NaphS2]|nr:conserved hypothetical protein [delta proteobacterium NaphS2]
MVLKLHWKSLNIDPTEDELSEFEKTWDVWEDVKLRNVKVKGSSLLLTFDFRYIKKTDYVKAIKNRIPWSLVSCYESWEAGRRNFY